MPKNDEKLANSAMKQAAGEKLAETGWNDCTPMEKNVFRAWFWFR